MDFRIGQGWDVHRLVAGRPLILGGVTIPFDKGLLGHSDADALLHAITDAILGGAGLGDIGRHFPDTDPAFKGADSRLLLREACRRVGEAGWRVGNVDASILVQAPKMAPHIAAMVANIAADLGIEAACVNIKAKTYEKLGPVGAGDSIEAQAVCLLVKQKQGGA
ncbi:2-C-methyl-D-erythritol 2,4-cyclodiphosphate synthase [Chitinimonas sp.]|uniref:2-C-methyl-D-erythritol 2,4-cyclodiphosphate synthase n=1 Tax=Chitinimonas sp. TaxID=1934313 RepID=UPI0035B12D28